ncbi:MAG: hypothetical protein K2I36_01250, partial [Ureaplasma sp.]|nr:hypothetical protein [Ureaplasma sp.]
IEDWSCILIPILIALEGYIKILLRNWNINLDNKNNSFDCFKKEKSFYVLVSIYNEREIKIEDDYKNHIEECYKFLF